VSPITLLFLKRDGKFKATSMVPNNHKCGSMRSIVYTYSVKIKAAGSKLTPEGFVLNNELVHEYFIGKFGVKAPKWDAVSCELMALTAAKELADLICSQGVDCRSVWVSITGSNGAKITAQWDAGRASV
jgi:hypothetical protein